MALTGDAGIGADTYADIFDTASSTTYSVEEDIGGCWSTSTDDFTVPHKGLYWFGGHLVSAYYISGFYLYKTVSGTTTAITTGDSHSTPYGYATTSNLRLGLNAGDIITWFACNTEGGTHPAKGATDKNKTMCQWSMIRRD